MEKIRINGFIIYNKMKNLLRNNLFSIFLFIIFLSIPFIIYRDNYVNNILPLAGDGLLGISRLFAIKNAINNGEFPWWTPLLSNGIPLAADSSMGIFYPFNYLILIMPIKAWFYFYYSFHLAVGAVFTYKYLKKIECNKWIALITSIIYYFSIHLGGYRLEHHRLIACCIFLPIVLYYIERYLRELQLRYLLLSSILMALQFLMGFPQAALYTDIIAGVYLIVFTLKNNFAIKKIIKDVFIWGISYLGLIMIQIIPFIELALYYMTEESGSSFEYFKGFSIHPIKLIMMSVPRIFGKFLSPLAELGSSGFDIEIFLGNMVLIIILIAILKYQNDFYIHIATIFIVITFIYASNGCFNFVANIIYRIPVLNFFRVPSRSLFIFIFFCYVIFAKGFTKIIEEKMLNELIQMVSRILMFVLGLVVIETITIYLVNLSSEKTINYVDHITNCLSTVWVLVFMLGCLLFFNKISKKSDKHEKISIYYLLPMIVLVVTLFEVFPYWNMANSSNLNDYKTKEGIEEILVNDIENYKIWEAIPNNSKAHYTRLGLANRNIAMDLSCINSYVPYNNPRLLYLLMDKKVVSPKFNFSGLYIAFPEAGQDIIYRNDVLSMLGVKYIINYENLIELSEDIEVYDKDYIIKKILYSDKVELKKYESDDDVFYEKINLSSGKNYRISFECDSVEEKIIIADFYGGAMYDNGSQDVVFNITPEIKRYKQIVNSENIPDESNVVFRLLLTEGESATISDVKIEEIESNIQKDVYSLYYKEEEKEIYENKNAKDILYVPDFVKSIDDVNNIYDDTITERLDINSFIVDSDIEGKVGEANIKNIKHLSNSIEADVSAQSDTFINFSQNYYPGWRAYIDGNETELYMVNGLIQGIAVQKGEHHIKFIFEPLSVYIGVGISTFFMIIIIIFSGYEYKKGRRKS